MVQLNDNLRKSVAAVLLEVAAGRDDSDRFGVIKFSRESDSQESSSNDELEISET